MTLHIYTIAWNEEFMLPYFLKHYSRYASRIFVIDDHSTDRTAEIAKAHPLVTYIPYRYNGLNEKEFSETFVKMAKEYPSDWAVCVDTDEFIKGLGRLGDNPGVVLKTKGYMMLGRTGRLEDCKAVRMETFDKPVVFDPKLDIQFGDGRHTVNKHTLKSDLKLLHYKYPSREYYVERNMASYPRIMDSKMADYRLNKGIRYYDRNI